MRRVAAVFGTNWQAQQRKPGAAHGSLGMVCARWQGSSFSIKRHRCICENMFLESQIQDAYFSSRKPLKHANAGISTFWKVTYSVWLFRYAPSVSGVSKYLCVWILVTVTRILKFINHFKFSNHFVTSPCFNSDVLRVPAKALTRGPESRRDYARDTLHTKSLRPGGAQGRVPSRGCTDSSYFFPFSFSPCRTLTQLHPALWSDYT